MLDILSRWNRWGSAALASGHPRDLLPAITPFLRTKDVVALVGPRRAGKSTLMYQLMDALETDGVPREAVLHVNLEEPGLQPTLSTHLLDEILRTYRESVHPSGRAWVFLDEIQQVPGWERWVRARGETDHLKIVVTGSSSQLMSRELGTLLTGRHVRFTVWPLSFAESLRFGGIRLPARARLAGNPPVIMAALRDYLKWGGFPEVVLAADDDRRERILKQYLDDILFKDVALRHEVRDLPTLRSIAVHLLTSTASLLSAQRISRVFGISLDLAQASCAHLEEAYLVQLAPMASLKVAERRRNPQKVHAVDTGLRNAVCLSASEDQGRVAETAAFMAMRRLGDDGLFYWRGDGEIDIARRAGNAVSDLVQVVLDPRPEGVLARELASIAEAAEHHPRARSVLVTGRPLGELASSVPTNVHAVPLWRFLLDPLEDRSVSQPTARRRQAARPTTTARGRRRKPK